MIYLPQAIFLCCVGVVLFILGWCVGWNNAFTAIKSIKKEAEDERLL